MKSEQAAMEPKNREQIEEKNIRNRDTSDEAVLERFMKEFFDFKALCKAGFFKPEWKKDYKAQAERVCTFFGYKTVYEYGAEEVRAHISYADGHKPKGEGFITVIPSIYD
ncbi:MAG: hypothetical protein K0S09_37 [Sphingobacteriaceae bacterium]|jgi:hypothetical protein|nr:hypothetical protein [Sphingobacteriaceae bacterium]